MVLAHPTRALFVSDWAGRAVLAVRPDDLRLVPDRGGRTSRTQFDPHPKDEPPVLGRPAPSTNNVSVIDTKGELVNRRTIDTLLFPKSPKGARPMPGRRSRRQALRRQCRQQLRRRDRYRRAEPKPGQGLHSHRLVSDVGGRDAAMAKRCWSASAREANASRTRLPQKGRRLKPETAEARDGCCRFPTSAPRFPARCRSCRCPTISSWPHTPRPSTAIARIPTSC